MNDALIYFLKVNIAIALFYLFYRLFFANDTFWGARRYYLISCVFLSAVYPSISLTGWLEKQEPMQAIMTSYAQLQEITVTVNPASNLTIENILFAVYALGSIVLLARMFVQLVSIFRWKMKGKKQTLYGIEIVAIDKPITPFSFFNAIFINPALHNEQETNQILAHELTHAHQLHSLDVLLSEVLTIVCWINPAAWLLKREIRQNLEFLADNHVLESGFDSKNYQYHLLQLSYQVPNVMLVNKFNVLPLKKRITMMNQQKTKKAGLLKYSLIVPLALALILSSNAQTVVNSAQKALATTKVKTAIQPSNKDKVYTVVEKMPVYPGDEQALMEFISQNLKYPEDAIKNKEQGQLIVRFVVSSSGKVENAEILRGLTPSMNKEALRVVNLLQDFTPGKQNGEKVAVWYTLPITFKLDGDASKTKTSVMDPKNPPVVIINGKKMPADFDINSIKPETIESMNVLKPKTDGEKADLISKYGEKAANGVIEITLKK